MAEEVEQTEVEETTEQESPTVEENASEVEETESAEKPEQTPESEAKEDSQERNWKALREELNKTKSRLEQYESEKKPVESNLDKAKKSDVVTPWLSQADNTELQLDEFKAEQNNPELDPSSDSYDPLFERVVAGEYRAALDEYSQAQIRGQSADLPKVSKIAGELKNEWEARFGEVSEKAKEEGAKAAKKSVSQKAATTEAQGRSDKRQQIDVDEDHRRLIDKSRRGDDTAIAERIARSEL